MQEENSHMVKNILFALAEYKNVKGIRGLADYLGETTSRLYGWIRNGRIADHGSILIKIPEVDPQWLRSGNGSMLRTQSSNVADVGAGSTAVSIAQNGGKISSGNSIAKSGGKVVNMQASIGTELTPTEQVAINLLREFDQDQVELYALIAKLSAKAAEVRKK